MVITMACERSQSRSLTYCTTRNFVASTCIVPYAKETSLLVKKVPPLPSKRKSYTDFLEYLSHKVIEILLGNPPYYPLASSHKQN